MIVAFINEILIPDNKIPYFELHVSYTHNNLQRFVCYDSISVYIGVVI